MICNHEFLSEAILQIIYTNKDHSQTWIRGTSFILSYKGLGFIVTATHCIDDSSLSQLFFSKISSKRHRFCLPIQAILKCNDIKGTKVETDLTILKINDEEYRNHLKEAANLESISYFSNQVIKTPLIQKLIHKYKSHPLKLLKKIKETTLYKTITKRQNQYIEEKLKNANTSLAEIKDFKLAQKDFTFEAGKKCIFIGYSISKGLMDYDDYGHFIKAVQYIAVYSGYLTGIYNEASETYDLKYETDDNLDGLSGGPVICDNKVIGMISTIAEKEKILKFIPFVKIIEIFEYYIHHFAD